jgi:hypothetical protein
MSSPTSSEESGARLSAVPAPSEALEGGSSAESAQEAAPAPPREEERVSKKLFLVVLVALLLAVMGLVVQSQRIGGFRAEIGALEGEVAGLASELAAANDRVESFAAQRQQIHRSVQLVIDDLLTLEGLVASDPASATPLAPLEAAPEGAALAPERP